MAKTMIASMQPITDGQIDNAAAKFRDALRKHRSEFGSEPVQDVLGIENLGMRLLEPFRALVEARSDMIVRVVAKIDRSRTPQEVLDATGRKQYTDRTVVEAMPRGTGDKAETVFFTPDTSAYDKDGLISDDNLEKEFEFRGLVPEDPYSLAAQNEDDPAFADEHPNVTHWKDASGKWCYATFSRWRGGRFVFVSRYDRGWDDRWSFAGRRK